MLDVLWVLAAVGFFSTSAGVIALIGRLEVED